MAANGQLKLNARSDYRSSPKFSFQGRTELKEKVTAPGPGQYKPVETDKVKFNASQRWSWGHAPGEDKPYKASPGPGEYVSRYDSRFKDAPKWGMGSGARLPKDMAASSPGPCRYDTRGNLDGQQSSMSSRAADGSKRASTPGPGQYKPGWESTLASSQRYSFGSSSRGHLVMSKTPGPGSYPTMSTLGGNPVIKTPGKYSMTYRHALPTGDVTPGPPAAGTIFGD